MDDIETPSDPSFIDRVLANDSARKGLATAAAGIVIAVVMEALWPNS